VIDSGVDQAKLNILEAEDYGDTATSTGEYILLGKSMQLDKGKYIVIWKQQEGQWKLHRDIWTTSLNSVT
jgi:ketosteroid isomerase-like protein